MHRERGDDQGQHGEHAAQHGRVAERLPFVQGHHVLGLGIVDGVGLAEQEPGQQQEDGDQQHGQRREVEQEVVERQRGSAADDDVRGVPDQGADAADVADQGLGDEEHLGARAEPVTDQQGHRGHQQHGGDVVQQRRGAGGDQAEQYQQPEGRPLARLASQIAR